MCGFAETYHTETSLLSLCSLFHIRTQTQITSRSPNSKNFASVTLRLCDAAGEPRPIWCKNTALFLISHSSLPRWTFVSASIFTAHKKKTTTTKKLHLPFRPQNRKMLCLDTTLRQGFAGLRSAVLDSTVSCWDTCGIFLSKRLTFSHVSQAHGWLSGGKLKRQKPNVAWILTKPAAADWLRPPCWDPLIRTRS